MPDAHLWTGTKAGFRDWLEQECVSPGHMMELLQGTHPKAHRSPLTARPKPSVRQHRTEAVLTAQ